ncbi:MAG: aminoacyl-tRNA hydrolase [Gammaproteobacteria bacterium]|jgi:peptidyl-tRNA hydrolase, PTH1 family|nr:aminoacyl-tRNA hydrolase [Gammaproteobacteria bacterium]MBT5203101.1 aminoacyl-tRNA hydrolase [Gammaproteobacteria bacterium]MBT5602731.1 aminoacyl-tRNA hydrolase [Gammaproteobacteria bacterium]MBT6247086.1 aminoacyl-tRNA hydrolase [Gammaproteobacteria bacterium]
MSLTLIVGLGNPGAQYSGTRHNAGIWFVEMLARKVGVSFKEEKKFFGRQAIGHLDGAEFRLFIPNTFMNESGKAVGALCHFFKIPAASVLVAHDELDLPAGTVRLKQGGGLAGHNGLKDIARHLAGDQSFQRLRIGIGHPGNKKQVTPHVLSKPAATERASVDGALAEVLDVVPALLVGRWEEALKRLHTAATPERKAPASKASE